MLLLPPQPQSQSCSVLRTFSVVFNLTARLIIPGHADHGHLHLLLILPKEEDALDKRLQDQKEQQEGHGLSSFMVSTLEQS